MEMLHHGGTTCPLHLQEAYFPKTTLQFFHHYRLLYGIYVIITLKSCDNQTLENMPLQDVTNMWFHQDLASPRNARIIMLYSNHRYRNRGPIT